MIAAELKASVRIQDTGTLRTLKANLLARQTEGRSDIASESDAQQLHAINEELQRRDLADRLREQAFEDWLAEPTLASVTARGLIARDETGAARHAFKAAYLQGRCDGANSLQHAVLAAANAPMGQVPL